MTASPVSRALGLVVALASSSLAAAETPGAPQCASTAKGMPTQTITVCNSTPIQLNAVGAASLYPSQIQVSGVSGVVSRVDLRVLGVTHGNTSTMQLLLQPPIGDPVGINNSGFLVANPLPPTPPIPLPTATNATWTFSDQAPEYALFAGGTNHFSTRAAPTSTRAYLPRNFAGANLPAPAPAALQSQLLSSLVGRDPNGSWSLFAAQLAQNDAGNPQPTGTIAGGWCLDIETTPASTGCYVRTVLTGAITTADMQQMGRINRNGIVGLCTAPKTNALFASTSLHYDAFPIVNQSSQRSCVTVSADFNGCAGNSTQLVVYDQYNPAAPGVGVISDQGFSTTARLSNSFALDPGAGATIVVHEITAASGCAAYTVLVEQNPCQSAPAGLLFADGFESP